MKFADSQIDVLLTRHGQHAKGSMPREHLDADEINAFAEGSAPAATRARYVAHLAECDDCRKLATQLAISTGAVATVASGSIPFARDSVWQRITSFFAPPALRYAAFAVIVIAAVGVTFIGLRHQNESRLSSGNEPASVSQSAVPKSPESRPADEHVAQSLGSPSNPGVQRDKNATENPKPDQPLSVGGIAPQKAGKDEVAAANNPVDDSKKKAAEPAIVAEQQRSYAPLPPGEADRAQTKSREESGRDLAGAPGPRKAESSERLKMSDRSQTAELSKDQRIGGPNRTANNQQVMNQATQSSNESARSTLDATVAPKGADARKAATVRALRTDSEKAPEVRSVRGHKFRRQGNAWIDVKFKSSLAVINVARGSDEFRALNSELRSIAEQIDGEVIVVKSGKAYRIK